ncbi:MAG: DUF6680 family protein [Herbaspirillum sp.]
MSLTNILIILATIFAPLFAVQVQKWLERFREDRNRKLQIFKTLMSTRATLISTRYVEALNMIDLEFRGSRYKSVRADWKTYLDHLSSYPKEDEKYQVIWGEKRLDLLTELLIAMGKSLGYEFDQVEVKKGIYAPMAYSRNQDEDVLLRRGITRILHGESSLKMDITSFPDAHQRPTEQQVIRK